MSGFLSANRDRRMHLADQGCPKGWRCSLTHLVAAVQRVHVAMAGLLGEPSRGPGASPYKARPEFSSMGKPQSALSHSSREVIRDPGVREASSSPSCARSVVRLERIACSQSGRRASTRTFQSLACEASAHRDRAERRAGHLRRSSTSLTRGSRTRGRRQSSANTAVGIMIPPQHVATAMPMTSDLTLGRRRARPHVVGEGRRAFRVRKWRERDPRARAPNRKDRASPRPREAFTGSGEGHTQGQYVGETAIRMRCPAGK